MTTLGPAATAPAVKNPRDQVIMTEDSQAPAQVGHRLVSGDGAYYRFSDITFEWHKELSPYQANAVKSLLSNQALTDPTHPLREKRGQEEGVVFYIATCKDDKPRMFITFKQVEYLVYWIEKMKLVKDGERIPLPSTKSLLFEDDLDDMVRLMLTDPDLVKRALNRPHQIYYRYKEEQKQKQQQRESPAEVPEEVVQPTAPSLIETGIAPESKTDETHTTSDPTALDSASSDLLDSAAKTAFYRAEQVLIVASSAGEIGLPVHLRLDDGNTSGKAAFLSIHFEASGLDTLCTVGWAASWFDEEGEECRDQGMWIAEDQVPGTTDYQFAQAEVMSSSELASRLSTLIIDVQAHSQPNAGPVYLIIHSTEKQVADYRLLGLPLVDSNYIIDTSELVTALSEDYMEASLQTVCKRMFSGAGQPVDGFGSSGDDAFWNLELFMTLASSKFDLARALLEKEPDSDNEEDQDSGEEARYFREVHGVGLDDVTFNLDDLDYDIGPGGPEDDEDFA